MNKEELVNLSMKETVLNKWKSKLSYPFTHKDLEELENIIDYYEEENFNLREGIYIEKMSFPSEGRNFKDLIEMPTYKQLQNNWNELKKYLEENKYFYSGLQGEDREEDTSIIEVLNKMQELERGEE